MKKLLMVTMIGLSLTGFSTFKEAEAGFSRVGEPSRSAEIADNRAGFALVKQGRYAEAEPYFLRELATAPQLAVCIAEFGSHLRSNRAFQ